MSRQKKTDNDGGKSLVRRVVKARCFSERVTVGGLPVFLLVVGRRSKSTMIRRLRLSVLGIECCMSWSKESF
jgi:hypothetical protein